jgi:PIN domain nuclease of toxin-antitoxin system
MIETDEVVLDASAVLALILRESRAKVLTGPILDRSVLSSVNLAEVQSKLVRDGYDPQAAWNEVLLLTSRVVPFSQEQVRIAGDLIAITKPMGLSLGDRSCLALAITLQAAVYTSESMWESLNLGIPIHVIR